jgi:hypothetical protein
MGETNSPSVMIFLHSREWNLKCYPPAWNDENFEIFETFWKLKKKLKILKSHENFEFFWFFENFEILWN